MEPKQDESNWAHACRVLGLDPPGVVFATVDHSAADASRPSARDGSSDLHGTSIALESQLRLTTRAASIPELESGA
jgi:hypothetical protein